MDHKEIEILRGKLLPLPSETTFHEGAEVPITRDLKFSIMTPAQEADSEKKIQDLCRQYWGTEVTVEILTGSMMEDAFFRNMSAKLMHHRTEQESAEIMRRDAYKLKVTQGKVCICAECFNGILNALKTLRQLSETQRGVAESGHHILFQCEISDAPVMAFRGIHFCYFPETPYSLIEKSVRLAAYYKFNYAVIEFWGVFPFVSHPELSWETKMASRSDIIKLVRLGKDLGITLIPQFNLLGHASASRFISFKHAVLEFKPQLESLFEPEGWSWCLTNPETRRVITDIVDELYEVFDSPPLFHIGCDEADNLGVCAACRKKPLSQLVRDHITYFHDHLKKKNCRTIMWHDMLLRSDDLRWDGYIVCGQPSQHLDDLVSELPHDMIIADWQYGYPKHGNKDPEWPTMKFFKSEGFNVLACPWYDNAGIKSLGANVEKEGLMGMLGTTWDRLNGMSMFNTFHYTAQAAWGGSHQATVRGLSRPELSFARHHRQISCDMGFQKDYPATGNVDFQIPEHTFIHNN